MYTYCDTDNVNVNFLWADVQDGMSFHTISLKKILLIKKIKKKEKQTMPLIKTK